MTDPRPGHGTSAGRKHSRDPNVHMEHADIALTACWIAPGSVAFACRVGDMPPEAELQLLEITLAGLATIRDEVRNELASRS